MSHRFFRSTRVVVGIIALGIAAILISGCTVPAGSHVIAQAPHPVIRAEVALSKPVRVFDNLQYGRVDGHPLLLDLCAPARAVTPTVARWPAVVLVHGGSWTHGDKSEWLAICRWMASDGFVAATIDYRLAPAHVFPAGIHDVETAVRWLKSPAQGVHYAIDPDRIGAFGGSAGGNLVALLGVSGTGPLDRGDRVRAVAELSGPINLTSSGLEQRSFYPAELSYLGCASYTRCPQAVAASPVFHVKASDPPFFIAQSTHERIPLVQSQAFVATLRGRGSSHRVCDKARRSPLCGRPRSADQARHPRILQAHARATRHSQTGSRPHRDQHRNRTTATGRPARADAPGRRVHPRPVSARELPSARRRGAGTTGRNGLRRARGRRSCWHGRDRRARRRIGRAEADVRTGSCPRTRDRRRHPEALPRRAATDAGITVLQLETGPLQHAAIALYERSGFELIPNFGKYTGDPNSVCFEKRARLGRHVLARVAPTCAARRSSRRSFAPSTR